MDQETKLFWAMADCLKPAAYKKIIELFGDLKVAKDQISLDILLDHGFHKRSAESIIKKTKEVDLEKAKEVLKKCGAKVLFGDDPMFPESLKKIDDAPLFLFAKGDFSKLKRKSLAVVGSRTVSPEGKWACENLLPEIISSGFTLVSGMAAGVDTLAHKAALQNNGSTVAFWGTGIDLIYPSINRNLATEIMNNGVVFSEFPLGTPPNPYNFPRRNRLVSGYSDGVLVVEGKEKSGSLITAEFAMEQGKEVFAVPGPIRSPLSHGPHKLIQEGAKLAQKSSDILEEFGVGQESLFLESTEKRDVLPEHPEERKVYESLTYSPTPFDTVCEKTGFASSQLSSLLMMMSLNGVVEEVGNGWVRR